MTIRLLLTNLTLLLLTGASIPSPSQAAAAESAVETQQQHPNVVFILTDDQRWNCIGLADRLGGARRRTLIGWAGKVSISATPSAQPRSVRPAARRFWADCMPTAMACRTTSPSTRSTCRRFPRQLQKAGYQTAYIGKYHMGEKNDDERPGFDYFVTHQGTGQVL